MTPEQWQLAESLYRAAMKMPVESRAQYISEACAADGELREELFALIKASDEETVKEVIRINAVGHRSDSEFRSFSAGELILERFRIIRFVGGGGMGEVYEAHDLEMGRVALKTIRPEIAGDPEMFARFKQEVQLALKITNPHVCRIHALYVLPSRANKSRRAFLTMEFLDGDTLSDKLRRSGPLPWREAKAIALDICRGVQAIHDAGIIHRDLKSGNVMLTRRGGSDCAVLTDFGLASELRSEHSSRAAGPRLTSPGAVAGTPRYMAPEQFACDPLTPAADIFALGVVMYEMVTAKHPFPSSSTLKAAVERGRRPAAPSSIQKRLPRRCDAIVGKCLEFDPNRRYKSAKLLAEEIEGRLLSRVTLGRAWFRGLASATAAIVVLPGLLLVPAIDQRAHGMLFSSHEKHIAFLPFEFAERDPRTQAVGDGLTDSLAGKLSNLEPANPSLWVVPATEVRKRKVRDASSALREFGATIVVQGHFEQEGEATHLTFTLIDPRKMKEIGYADVVNQAGDMVALEGDAVTRLARLMNLAVADGDARDNTVPAGHAAYQDYLAGVGYIQRYDVPGNLDAAISVLQHAVATDPHFALGFAKLGEAYRLKYQLDQNTKWLEPAQNYCGTAIGLDSAIASPYVTLARIHEITGQGELASHELQHALQVDPKNATTMDAVAYTYEHAGSTSLAEVTFRKVAALRPDDWDSYDELGNFYERQRKFSQAFAEYQHALELTPDNAQVYANLGMAYIESGDATKTAAAETALKKSIALFPTYNALANLGILYSREGRYREYATATEGALQLNDEDWRVWDNLVSAYEWLQDTNRADAARRKMQVHLDQAVKLKPQDADAQSTLAIVYAHDGLEERATERIRTALALAPDDPEVLNNVADAYEELGDPKRATDYLKRAFRKGLSREDAEHDPYLRNIMKGANLRLPLK